MASVEKVLLQDYTNTHYTKNRLGKSLTEHIPVFLGVFSFDFVRPDVVYPKIIKFRATWPRFDVVVAEFSRIF